VVPIQLSMGAWNTLQQSDGHAYWEFNYTTNWVHPLYELPFTGGIPGTFAMGKVGALQSIVPGPGPSGAKNNPVNYGDNPNGDGVVSAEEGDVDTASDGFENNERLFIPATKFNRFAVTREINDGLLAPRFAPSQKAWVLSGTLVRVDPAVPASSNEDFDDR